jgi:membrane associated rhomboid family serine protease
MELGQKLSQLYSSTPIGSILIILISIIFTLLFDSSLGVSVLDAINPFKLLFFSFYHGSWWHFIIAVIVFPLAAAKFEKEKGTLNFLYSYFVLQVLLGSYRFNNYRRTIYLELLLTQSVVSVYLEYGCNKSSRIRLNVYGVYNN